MKTLQSLFEGGKITFVDALLTCVDSPINKIIYRFLEVREHCIFFTIGAKELFSRNEYISSRSRWKVLKNGTPAGNTWFCELKFPKVSETRKAG